MIPSSTWCTRIAGVAIAVGLAACTSDPVRPNDSVPTRVVLEAGARDLASFGDSTLIRPVVYDQHGTPMSNVSIDWSVSKDGVVQFDGPGAFRAVGNGEVTVRAVVQIGATGVRPTGYWTEPVAATVNLRVEQRAARLSIAPVDTNFSVVNGVRRLLVTVTDARGNPMRTLPQAVEFRSANGEAVAVDATGLVRSRRLGSSRVSAHLAGLQAGLTFIVDPRLAHTSCMVVRVRRRSIQQCVTNGFTMQAPAGGR